MQKIVINGGTDKLQAPQTVFGSTWSLHRSKRSSSCGQRLVVHGPGTRRRCIRYFGKCHLSRVASNISGKVVRGRRVTICPRVAIGSFIANVEITYRYS